MSGVLVSVVLAVRNGGRGLEESVQSIVGQDFRDFELIVVDDGSDGGDVRMMDQLCAMDGRIRLVRLGRVGLTRALMAGCAEARGEWIARADAGDVSMSERLGAQLECAGRHPEAVLVSCATQVEGPGGEFLFLADGGAPEDESMDLRTANWGIGGVCGPSHHGATLFRTAAFRQVGGYRAEFLMAQDWDLWYRLGEVGKFVRCPGTLYRARISAGGLSMVRRAVQRQFGKYAWQCMRARAQSGSDLGVLDEVRAWTLRVDPLAPVSERAAMDAEARTAYFVGEALRRRGDRAAIGYLNRATELRPFWIRARVRALQARKLVSAGRQS